MQNSKSRLLHGSNGLSNKANEYSSRRLLSCPNSGKTACQTVWGDGLRAGTEKFPPRFKSERGSFISILNFNNFIFASMPTFYLQYFFRKNLLGNGLSSNGCIAWFCRSTRPFQIFLVSINGRYGWFWPIPLC